MADYAIHEETLYDIADVIRKKDGSSALIDPADYAERINLMGMLEEKTASGSVVAFSDGADAVKLKSCAVTIAPNLDGVSSVDVVQTGKNLIDWVVSATAFEFILPSGTYTFSVPSGSTIESGNWYFRGFDENGNPYTSRESLGLSQTWTHATGSHWNYSAPTLYRFTFTIPEGCSKLEIFKQNENGNIPAMIEVGSTSTDYEPYITPTTHTANLGRTIYGGLVDVVNGTGTDEYTFDLWDGTQNYNVSDNLTNVFRIYMAHAKPLPDPTVVQCICEGYTFPRAGWSSDTVSFYSDANNFTLKLPKTEVTTLAEAKAWLAQHNVTFLYATTPENFTFTPVPIITRLGDNTLWSDGDLSVVYRSSGTQTIIQPTLISKTVTANGTYTASDEGADGYDEVTVNVQGGAQNIETVLSSNPLIEVSGVSGTDVTRTMWTYTASASGKIVFHANTQVKTNTGANDGYFTVKKNDTVIATTYANTSTTTALSIPDIDIESGDVVTITCGFDNSHTSCWFDIYSTITILTENTPSLLMGSFGSSNSEEENEELNEEAESEEE